MTTALEKGEGSASRPGRSLPLWKTRYPLYRRLGRPQGRSGQVRKIWPSTGPRTVQSVASRNTDWAIPAHRWNISSGIKQTISSLYACSNANTNCKKKWFYISEQFNINRKHTRTNKQTKSIPSYSQQDETFLDLLISKDALHVSGGSSAHHQEHTTVQTASGIVNQYCC